MYKRDLPSSFPFCHSFLIWILSIGGMFHPALLP